MAVKTVFLTTTGTGTFTVPADFTSLVSVEAIGGGGGNGGGGAGGHGGGAYAKSTSVLGLVAGAIANVSVGAGGTSGSSGVGGDTWFNVVTNATPSTTAQGVLAKGGSSSTAGGSGGVGGLASSSVGDVAYSGGTGGNGNGVFKGGGGGAAGPGGAGGTGAIYNSSAGPGGGSGATLTSPGNAGTTGSVSSGGVGGASASLGTISFVSNTKNQNLSVSTTLTINTPSGIQDGDLLIAILQGTSTSTTWSATGWTSLSGTNVYGSATGKWIAYKFASSESATQTFTSSNSETTAGYVLAYRNATIDTGGAVNAAASPSVAAAITVSNNNSILLDFVSEGNSPGITFSTPTGFTVLDSESDSNSPSSAIFYQAVNAGSSGTPSSTPSANTARSVLIAIAPSGSGGTGSNGTTSVAIAGSWGSGGGGGFGTGAVFSGGGKGGAGYPVWVQTSNNATAGPGGGGGAGYGTVLPGGDGGGYGGGSGGGAGGSSLGVGAQGIIVFTYISNIIIARLSYSGNLLIPFGNEFNEITQSTISVQQNNFYASEFDEVSLPSVPMRYLPTGNVQIVGTFDETQSLT